MRCRNVPIACRFQLLFRIFKGLLEVPVVLDRVLTKAFLLLSELLLAFGLFFGLLRLIKVRSSVMSLIGINLRLGLRVGFGIGVKLFRVMSPVGAVFAMAASMIVFLVLVVPRSVIVAVVVMCVGHMAVLIPMVEVMVSIAIMVGSAVAVSLGPVIEVLLGKLIVRVVNIVATVGVTIVIVVMIDVSHFVVVKLLIIATQFAALIAQIAEIVTVVRFVEATSVGTTGLTIELLWVHLALANIKSKALLKVLLDFQVLLL